MVIVEVPVLVVPRAVAVAGMWMSAVRLVEAVAGMWMSAVPLVEAVAQIPALAVQKQVTVGRSIVVAVAVVPADRMPALAGPPYSQPDVLLGSLPWP